MKLLAKEAISSIKGSVKSNIIVQRKNGILIYKATPVGIYSFGILKRISPDGKPYEELKDTTLNKVRKWKGITRGPSFILRETSRHIFEGLHIKSFTIAPRGGKKIVIGWSGEDEEIANKQETGFTTINPVTEYFGVQGLKDVTIPARPFRGFQREFVDLFHSVFQQF